MKTNYKTKLIASLIIAVISTGSIHAIQPNLFTIFENSDNWVKIKKDNGIAISYSKANIDGNILMSIQFTNTTQDEITFQWDVKAKNGLAYRSYNSITVKAGETFIKTNGLEMKGSTSFESYPIILTIK